MQLIQRLGKNSEFREELMKRITTIVLTLVAAFGIAPSVWAQASCPSITGSWGATYEEVVGGSSVVGVANVEITGNRIDYWLSESTQGQVTADFATGSYNVDQWCTLSWNFTFSGSGDTGLVTGVILNPDKMFLILGSAVSASSGRLVLERMTQN